MPWQPAAVLDPDYNQLADERRTYTDRDMLTLTLRRLDKALAERDQARTRLAAAEKQLTVDELTQLHVGQLERLLRDARQRIADMEADR